MCKTLIAYTVTVDTRYIYRNTLTVNFCLYSEQIQVPHLVVYCERLSGSSDSRIKGRLFSVPWDLLRLNSTVYNYDYYCDL